MQVLGIFIVVYVVKIQAVGSKTLPPTDEVEHIEHYPPHYHQFECFDQTSRDVAIVVDFNKFLLCLHDKNQTRVPPDISTLYFFVVHEDVNLDYYLQNDAELFLLELSQFAKVFAWTLREHRELEKAMAKCLAQGKKCLSGWLSQCF